MRIAKLKINIFRNLSEVEIPIGRKLTAIAGQNGTSKTSLLGILSHIFNFNPLYRTLNNRTFSARFSEIFRFSYPEYDKAGKHKYTVSFEDGNTVDVLSYDRTKNKRPIDLRLRVGKSAKGRGKVKMPVIYLGMRRLFPFAQESKIKKDMLVPLDDDEAKIYKEYHNEILLMKGEDIHTARIVTKNKNFYAPATDSYDHLGISAGQDNIGQIITAVLSFRRLKNKLGIEYPGGLLFIDEIDASLYPGAQLKLIERLYKIASELNLQIIFTTHSLEVLDAVSKHTSNGDGTVVYLDRNTGKIIVKPNLDIQTIRRDLTVSGPAYKQPPKKIDVYCEDEVAKDFAFNILEPDIRKRIKLRPLSLSESTLQAVAGKRLPALNSSIFLLDGDVPIKKQKNVLQLPGGDNPEKLAYKLLDSIGGENEFWNIPAGFTKQFCFKDCDTSENKNKVKEWFRNQKRYWGRMGSKMWTLWRISNLEIVKKFNADFNDVLNQI